MAKYVIPAKRGKRSKFRSKSKSKSRSKPRSKSRSKPRNSRPIKSRVYTRKLNRRKRMSAANMKWLENKKKKNIKKAKKLSSKYYHMPLMFQNPSPSDLPLPPKGMMKGVSPKPHKSVSPLRFSDKEMEVIKTVMKDAFKSKEKKQILKKDDIKKMKSVSKHNPALLTPMMIIEANKNKKPINIFSTIGEGTKKKRRKKRGKKRKSKKL